MSSFIVFTFVSLTGFALACGSDAVQEGEPWELQNDFECLADECPEAACLSVTVENVPHHDDITGRTDQGPGFVLRNHCPYDLFFGISLLYDLGWVGEIRRLPDGALLAPLPNLLSPLWPEGDVPEGELLGWLRLPASSSQEIQLVRPADGLLTCFDGEAHVMPDIEADEARVEYSLLMPNPQREEPTVPNELTSCGWDCLNPCDETKFVNFLEDQEFIRSFETIRL